MRFNRLKAMLSAILACAVGILIYVPFEHSLYRTLFSICAI